MKNPYIFWTVFFVLLIGAFFLGNSAWAKKLVRGTNGNGNSGSGNQPTPPAAEGSVCDLPGGGKGVILNGVCSGGRPADTNPILRSSGSTIPNIILVPYSPTCRAQYTAANPYKYGGCSYVFNSKVQHPYMQNGVAYCQLEKISCP